MQLQDRRLPCTLAQTTRPPGIRRLSGFFGGDGILCRDWPVDLNLRGIPQNRSIPGGAVEIRDFVATWAVSLSTAKPCPNPAGINSISPPSPVNSTARCRPRYCELLRRSTATSRIVTAPPTPARPAAESTVSAVRTPCSSATLTSDPSPCSKVDPTPAASRACPYPARPCHGS